MFLFSLNSLCSLWNLFPLFSSISMTLEHLDTRGERKVEVEKQGETKVPSVPIPFAIKAWGKLPIFFCGIACIVGMFQVGLVASLASSMTMTWFIPGTTRHAKKFVTQGTFFWFHFAAVSDIDHAGKSCLLISSVGYKPIFRKLNAINHKVNGRNPFGTLRVSTMEFLCAVKF